MKKILLSLLLLLVSATFFVPSSANAQEAPKILKWWISYDVNTPVTREKNIPPTIVCTNGVPTGCTIVDCMWFDNQVGAGIGPMPLKYFGLEQLVPRWTTVNEIQVVEMRWIVKGITQKTPAAAKTYDVTTAVLEHNAGYDCIVRVQGVYQNFERMENGSAVYGPFKIGKTGVSWKLTCGAGGGASIVQEQGAPGGG